MKLLLGLVIVIVAVFALFNCASTGSFSLLSAHDGGGEMAELNHLQGDFMAAARQYRQAGRTAALSGVDSTSDAEAALLEVNRVEARVKEIGDKGPRKNYFLFSAPRCASDLDWAIEGNRRRSLAYVENFQIEPEPKMWCRWDAKIGSNFFAGPKSDSEELRSKALEILEKIQRFKSAIG